MRAALLRCGNNRCIPIVSTVAVLLVIVFLLEKNVTVVINEKLIQHTVTGNVSVVFNSTKIPMTTTSKNNRKVPSFLQKPLSGAGKQVSNRDPPDYHDSEWFKSAMEIQNDWKFSPRDFKCANITFIGNWPVCFDLPFRVSKPCLVYSFGIAFDFSFDNGMGKIGCEVHSFDPSMGWKDRITETGVHFHNLGLSSKNNDKFKPRQDLYVRNQQTWKLRTLKTVMEELNHKGMTLDILKIDVESHEWDVVENILDSGLFDNVRQFMLEWHLFPDYPLRGDFKKCSKIYRRLIDYGMKKYHTAEHPQTLTSREFNLQADTSHVNLKFTQRPHR